MQSKSVSCKVQDTSLTYQFGASVCTAGVSDSYDDVWQCVTEAGCTAEASTSTEWTLTRKLGTIVDVMESVDVFKYDHGFPYAIGDFVLLQDVMYECMSNRGLCQYFPPDLPWEGMDTETFDVDGKGDVAFGVAPWQEVTDKTPAQVLDSYVEREALTGVEWFEAAYYRSDSDGTHYFEVDETTCCMGQAAKCFDADLCNTVAPFAVEN